MSACPACMTQIISCVYDINKVLCFIIIAMMLHCYLEQSQVTCFYIIHISLSDLAYCHISRRLIIMLIFDANFYYPLLI